jgi:cytosine/adenosine deaminase-related metal-dependent hydrolase
MAKEDFVAHERSGRVSRRRFVAAGTAVMATGAAALAQQPPANQAASDRLLGSRADAKRRILLQGGIVLSLDARVGDFERGDVLVEGSRIAAVGPDLRAAAEGAVIIDATDRIVMPGFVDTHHHQYQTVLRSALADGLLFDGARSYVSVIQGLYTPLYLPQDAYISQLVASLSQISAGVTTTVDTSQVSHTPAHTDACIDGLRESGRRAVFAYSGGSGQGSQYPQDIVRLRKQYFSSSDQLLTLALGGVVNAAQLTLARSVSAPLVAHFISGDLGPAHKAGLLGPDIEYIHCTQANEATWKLIADTGGHVSIAPAIEMQMRHGMPPFQAALDHGIRPSLSVDVECNMTADMFTNMRAAFTVQRALANQRAIEGDRNPPRLMTARETIELATIVGAEDAHLGAKIGTLTPGKDADIILLATDRVNVFPLNNVPGTVVTMMDTSNVDAVFIAGRVMKWRGELVGVDLPRIRRLIDQARDGLLARAKAPRNLFDSCCAPG